MKLLMLTLAIVIGMLVMPAATLIDRPDAWITMKAKMALIGALGSDALQVNVDTIDGKVTLHGRLPSDERRAAAEAAVRGIEGVSGLRDLVQVVAEPMEKAVEASDDAIQGGVGDALKADPLLKDVSVSVASVNKGVVLLKGEVKRLSDELRAMQVAARQTGVTRVETEITFDDGSGLFDDELARPKELAREAGQAVRDGWLTTEVKLKLMAAEDVPGLDINVDTTDGAVTLFGTVDSEAARAAALTAARDTAGVREVKDGLTVSGRTTAEAADDAQVAAKLKSLIDARRGLLGDGIEVKVEKGIAHLRGTVPSVSGRLTASSLARQAGARAVANDLEVNVSG